MTYAFTLPYLTTPNLFSLTFTKQVRSTATIVYGNVSILRKGGVRVNMLSI